MFVTGVSDDNNSPDNDPADYATVACDAATGAQLWLRRYTGPVYNYGQARSLAVSPRGDAVYITGPSYGDATGSDYATVAYNAVTGSRRWVQRYNGPDNSDDTANSVAVSPDGAKVIVTGGSVGTTSRDYTTIAYSG